MHKLYVKGIFISIFCISAPVSIAADLYVKPNARAETTETQSGEVLSALSPKSQILELNVERELSVQLLSDGVPTSPANVTWSIEQKIISQTSRQSAFFTESVSNSPILVVVPTDENGVSALTLNTGEIVGVYSIKALATLNLGDGTSKDLSQTFDIVVGIAASVINDTPESGMAVSLDKYCPQLQASDVELTTQQQAMLARCNDIQQALSEGKTLEVSQVLRQMSPEEIAVQSTVGASFNSQQIANIASRLSAVRRGSSKISFSNLGVNYNGQSLPIGYLLGRAFSAADSDNQIGGLLSNRLGVFVNGNASFGSRNTTSREDGFDFDNYGLTIGADYRIKRASFAGVSLGLAKSDIAIASDGGEMDAAGKSIGVYGTHYFDDRFYIDGIINLGNNSYDMNRHIKFDLGGNPVDRTASSSTRGAQQGISAGGGYEFNDGALSINVYARVNYSKVAIDSFKESGAQELDLRIGSQSIDSLISSTGAQLAYAHSARWGILMPFLWFSWEHEFSGDADSITAEFGDDRFNTSFNINTEKEDSNYFSSGQGISLVLPRGVSLYVRMENILGREHYAITNISAGGRMELAF